MEIAAIKDAKRQSELAIVAIVKSFESQTRCKVHKISMDRSPFYQNAFAADQLKINLDGSPFYQSAFAADQLKINLDVRVL